MSDDKRLIAVLGGLTGVGVLLLLLGLASEVRTATGVSPTNLGLVLQAFGKRLLAVTLGLGVHQVIDRAFLPFLRIEQAFRREGKFSTDAMSNEERMVWVAGWFLTLAVIVLAFASAAS